MVNRRLILRGAAGLTAAAPLAVATISGHRDWHGANPDVGATECPGNTFYPRLPAIRRDVADLVRLGR